MSEEEVLTEEESEALLEQSDDTEIEDAGGVREPGSEVWEQVALNRIPALDAINDELADALALAWKRVFQREVILTSRPPQRLGGRAFGKRVVLDQSITAFEIKGRDEQGLFAVQPDTVSAMVDICFGGVGDSPRSDRLRELTEMEKRLLRRFTDAVTQATGEILQRRNGFVLATVDKPFEVDASPLCEFSARLVVCAFSFDIGETEHSLEFVWPAAFIDHLRSQAPKSLPNARKAAAPSWDTQLSEDVQGARVEVRAVIGSIPVRLHQISRAKTGDIILTEPLTRVRLLAAGKPVFEGTLGTHNGFNAVKIAQPCKRKHSGDA